jgi:hypothetical protein
MQAYVSAVLMSAISISRLGTVNDKADTEEFIAVVCECW